MSRPDANLLAARGGPQRAVVWLAMLALAGFAVMATLIANSFRDMAGAERFAATNAFLKHPGQARAFILIALYDLSHRKVDPS